MHLYLIRHGQSVENASGTYTQNSNSALTETGHRQAKALADWISGHVVLDRLYASSMQRARQTAEHLSAELNLPVEYDDRIREVGTAYGDGRPFPMDKLPGYTLDMWGSIQPYKPITEGGENWMQFRARVGDFLEGVLESLPEDHLKLRVGVVCHGGVIEGFFEHIFQKGPWSAVVVLSNNTGLTHLEYRPTPGMPSWRLLYQNSTRHLDEEDIT